MSWSGRCTCGAYLGRGGECPECGADNSSLEKTEKKFKFYAKDARELETMERYTIGLDLETRLGVARKLKELGFDDPKYRKGTQAALIRVLLNTFCKSSGYCEIENEEGEWNKMKPEDWQELIVKEYTYTLSKNKRSNL